MTKQDMCEFQRRLIELTKEYDCYLYAEDEYGAELLNIQAFNSKEFDLELFNANGEKRRLFKSCKEVTE